MRDGFPSFSQDPWAEMWRRLALPVRSRASSGDTCYAAAGECVIGPDGNWVEVSSQFCDALGLGAGELIGADFQALAHPADVEQELGLLYQLAEGQIERYEIEKRYFRRDGEVVWAKLSVSMARALHGAPGCVLVRMQLPGAQKTSGQSG